MEISSDYVMGFSALFILGMFYTAARGLGKSLRKQYQQRIQEDSKNISPHITCYPIHILSPHTAEEEEDFGRPDYRRGDPRPVRTDVLGMSGSHEEEAIVKKALGKIVEGFEPMWDADHRANMEAMKYWRGD